MPSTIEMIADEGPVRKAIYELADFTRRDIQNIAEEALLQEGGATSRDALARTLLTSKLYAEVESFIDRIDEGVGLGGTRPAMVTEGLQTHLAEFGATKTYVGHENIWDSQDPATVIALALGLGILDVELSPAWSTNGMSHPAIPSVIVPDLARLLAGPLEIKRVKGQAELRTRKWRGRKPRRVAHLITTPATPDLPDKLGAMAKAITSINTQRWLRQQVFAVWHYHLSGWTSNVVEIDGGFRALLHDTAGRTSGKAATRMKLALQLLQHTELPRPVQAGPLIELSTTRSDRVRLKIELTGPLQMGFANALKGLGERNRRLVPLPLEIPPFGDLQTNRHAAAAAFEMLLLDTIRENAEELLDADSIHLPQETLHERGALVSLPPGDVDYLMNLWCSGDQKLLNRLPENQYELGPTRGLMKQFLLEGAKATQKGRVRRKRSK